MTKPEQESRSSGRLAARGVQKAEPLQKKTKAAKETKETKAPKPKAAKKEEEAEGEAEGDAAEWVVGKEISAISLTDQTGTEVNLLELAKKSGFVIFFVPKANTPGNQELYLGCNKQACLFRDEYAKFAGAGFKVFGCSKDSVKSMASWKEKFEFQYDLLSDPKQVLIAAVGAKDGAKTTRSHGKFDLI